MFANNEMGDIGGQIILVKAAEIENLGGKSCLKVEVSKHWTKGQGRGSLLTRSLAGMLVQQTTMPLKGAAGSKASSSKSDDGGGDSIMF